MAKSKPRAPNTRAARRAASPSLDVDRSLVNAPRMEASPEPRPAVLADRSGAGIQKKQKQKRMTRAQRLRQQKGMDRAEAVIDQLEIKKAKSLTRGKAVKARSAEWEALNKKTSGFAALQEDDDEDDDDDDAMATEATPAQAKPNPFVSHSIDGTAEETAPVEEEEEDEDEL